MNDEKRAELLLNHYNDTFQQILYHWKARNRLFLYALIVLTLLAFASYSPGLVSGLIHAYLKETLKYTTPIDLAVVESAGWFVLLSLVIQYYQRSIHVDRQYKYISEVEKHICEAMGGDYITREGKGYYSKTGVATAQQQERRPVYLRSVGLLYQYAFPLLLIVFAAWGVVRQASCLNTATGVLNLLAALMLIAYNAFYLLWVVRRH